MKKLLVLVFLAWGTITLGQVAVNSDGSAPDNSAMLDIKSTTKGMLAPRMTLAQRNAISSPATGLTIFQTDGIPGFYYNSGTPAAPSWAIVGNNASQWLNNGSNIYYNLGKVGIATSTPAALLHVAEDSPSYTAVFGNSISSYTTSTNVSFADDNASTRLYIGQSSTNKGFLIWNYNATAANAFLSLGTYFGDNPLVFQPAGGFVGIGTTVPASLLDVSYDANNHTYLGYSEDAANYIYRNEQEADGDGQCALYAFRTRPDENNGTAYGTNTSNTAIKGYSFYGDQYSFGVEGFNYNDLGRSGGLLGAQAAGAYWGALGYNSSSLNTYGGFFTSYSTGTSKSNQVNSGIGIGAWGELIGADIHGKVYGIYAEGANYALFSNGPVYKNNLDVHLQENGTNKSTVLYTNVSTDITVMTSGFATLVDGSASIDFDQAFAAAVSQEEPVVVTVTPIGQSNWVYLAEVTKSGFSVKEGNNGKSSVTVSYMAIGKRAGYEHPVLSEEVTDATYIHSMARGLHNDSDLETNGEGLYYENGKLVVGIHPSSLPDPNRGANEFINPKLNKSKKTGFENKSNRIGTGECKQVIK